MDLPVKCRDPVERHHDLSPVDDSLLDDEAHHLSRLGMEDQPADGADALAFSVHDVGAEWN